MPVRATHYVIDCNECGRPGGGMTDADMLFARQNGGVWQGWVFDWAGHPDPQEARVLCPDCVKKKEKKNGKDS